MHACVENNNNSSSNNNKCFRSRVPIFCVTFQVEPWREAHGSPRQCRTAAETATAALVVATRAAVDRCWLRCPTTRTPRWTLRTPPYGDRRLAPAPRWALPSTTNSPRTMAGSLVRSGQRHCLSRGRRGRCSVTQASGTNLPRISMFLCCTWWSCCPTSSSFPPRLSVVAEQDLIGQDSAALGGLSASTADGGPVGGSAHDHILFFVAAIVEQNVDIPVQRGGRRSLQGLRPGQGSTQRTVEQTADR